MNAPSAPARSRTAGFSLIELIFTLVLLAIMLMLAAPNLRGWVVQTRVDAAANELMGDISYARMLAVRAGRPDTVTIGSTWYTIKVEDRTAKRVDLAKEYGDMQITTSATPLVFNSRGLLQQSSSEVIISFAQQGKTASLRVLPTGRAQRDY